MQITIRDEWSSTRAGHHRFVIITVDGTATRFHWDEVYKALAFANMAAISLVDAEDNPAE